MMDVRNAVVGVLRAAAGALWLLWNLPAALAAACAQCREEENDARLKAIDGGAAR